MKYENFEELKKDCLRCKKCKLADTRTNIVFGVGDVSSKILFVGEGPGENEDLQGEPFVGRSGKLLDEMLSKIGLNRENIYIANIVKCRPPGNRDPLPEEQDVCINWLRYQTLLMKPKIIVTLGRIAAMKIIREDFRVTREHGKFFEKKDTCFMGTFHPAAILRNPTQKSVFEEDFLTLKRKLQEMSLI